MPHGLCLGVDGYIGMCRGRFSSIWALASGVEEETRFGHIPCQGVSSQRLGAVILGPTPLQANFQIWSRALRALRRKASPPLKGGLSNPKGPSNSLQSWSKTLALEISANTRLPVLSVAFRLAVFLNPDIRYNYQPTHVKW